MRGNQLVVAGDAKQLPPTSFFQASQVDDSDGDEEEDDSTEQPDYESVLAACSTVLPQKMLRWHYRSRHEGLIAFSNARLFESRLVTFPSATDAESEMGVRWVLVPDGVYDRGKSRTNAGGILTSGFGPLNRAGGERRLSVAITLLAVRSLLERRLRRSLLIAVGASSRSSRVGSGVGAKSHQLTC
jgi:superfamily I DNA and/or RNA helicase